MQISTNVMRLSSFCMSILWVIFLMPLHVTTIFAENDNESLYKQVDWHQLIPEEDLLALQNPPDYLMDIAEGSERDRVGNKGTSSEDLFFEDEYQRALVSTNIVPEMDGKAIRIPGFIVPLEFNEDKTVSQFFLVPFFGACIHVPPPPPNQIIFVNSPEGVELKDLQTPHWISGIVRSVLTENEVAASSYAMDAVSVDIYWNK